MGKKPFSPEQEVRHYAVVLRQIIRAAGLTITEVERRLGQGPKSLRRVFGGQVDLKLKHVVSVLHVLGMSQEKFFEMAAEARRKRRRTPVADMLKTFEELGYRGNLAPVDEDDDPPPPGGFDRLVEDTVKRVVERLELERRADRPVPPPISRDHDAGDLGKDDAPGSGE